MIKIIVVVFFLTAGNAQHLRINDFIENSLKETSPMSNDPRLAMDPQDLITHYNYVAEKHVTETTDGFLLSLHRVVGNQMNFEKENKPVILLQHGFRNTAWEWILPGPNRSLPLLLADSGFDVWMPNARGTKYSNINKKISPKQQQYWDFSFHEIGVYDLSKSIDFILKYTKKGNLMYIGHGHGATVAYILLSERTIYNSKISALYSLAPIAFSYSMKSQNQQTITKWAENYSTFHYHISGNGSLTLKKWYDSCKLNIESTCQKVVFSFAGCSVDQFDLELYCLDASVPSDPISEKYMIHYGQLILSGHFSKFDYGQSRNEIMYGKNASLDYDLSKISVPTTIFYSDEDFLARPQDVKYLYYALPELAKNGLINVLNLNHFDFMWGKYAPSSLYNQIISSITQNNGN